MNQTQPASTLPGRPAKQSMGRLMQWLQNSPYMHADGRPLGPGLRSRAWVGYSLVLAWVLLTFWFVARSESSDIVTLEIPMMLAGFLIAGRLLNTELSINLLHSLPLRPQDIIRGQVLVATKWAVWSLAPLLLALWIAHVLWLSPSGRPLQVQGVVWAGLIFLLTLFFTLALGLSTNRRHGGLSTYRRRVILCQGALLLHSHWILESLSTTDEGRMIPLLKTCTLAAAIVLCALTLRTQLRAGLTMVKSPMWDIQEPYRVWIWLPAILFIPPLELSETGNFKALIYLVWLVHLFLSFQETSRSRRGTALRWFDIVLFIGLLQADSALWMQDITLETALGIQLLVTLVWWGLQCLGVGSPKRQAAENTAPQPDTPALNGSIVPARDQPDIPALDDWGRPGPQIDMANYRRHLLSRRIPVDRTTHLVQSACRYFFNFPTVTGNTKSLSLLLALCALFIVPFFLFNDASFSGLVLFAALLTTAIVDRIRKTLILHPLTSTLPVTNQEMGRSLLSASARLALPILSGLILLQLIFYAPAEEDPGDTISGLVVIGYCMLIGVIWLFGALASFPTPRRLHGLSKGWKLAATFQIVLALLCLLWVQGLPQLSLSYQLLTHGILWTTSVYMLWFAWRTQSVASGIGTGLAAPMPLESTHSETRVDKRWIWVPFLILYISLQNTHWGGFGVLITSIALIALVSLALHQSQAVREAQAETIVSNGCLGFFVLGVWLVIRSLVWPVQSDLDILNEYLFILVAWPLFWSRWEARRLSEVRKVDGKQNHLG